MRIAVIGIGSDIEDEDGSAASKRLHGEHGTLTEAWQAFDLVILVDAMELGVSSGTMRVLDAVPGIEKGESGATVAGSFSRIMERLPLRLSLSGREDMLHHYGFMLSPKNDSAVAEAAAFIREKSAA